MAYLRELKIHPNNRYFKNYEEDERYVLGKGDKNSDIFDTLVFVSRNIKNIVIPNCVKIIGKQACSYSDVESLLVTSQVTLIDDEAFRSCFNLETVEFAPDSQLEIIGFSSFVFTKIEHITFPSHLKKNKGCAFDENYKLITVEFQPNSELEELSIFSDSKLENIEIPKNVSKLDFSLMKHLHKVTIDKNNPYFKNYEKDKRVVLGKTDPKGDVEVNLTSVNLHILTFKTE